MNPQDDRPVTIQAIGLIKSFGRSTILRGIDLQVREGETMVLFGPNGAGKTTLLRTLSTLSTPSSGQIRIAGMDSRKQAIDIRQQIGVVLHETFLYENLSIDENLHFYGRMFGVERLAERIEKVLQLVGLDHRRYSIVRTLSRGMQQRAAIARAILHDPSVLLLDEPDTGLSQDGYEILTKVLTKSSGQSRTVVMTTHNLQRGLSISHRLAIMDKGKIAYQANSNELEHEELLDLYSEHTRVPH